MAMKIDREVLAGRIRELEGLSMEERSALLELLNTKKYGLVWDPHEEAVEEHLREYLPVLKEDTNKALTDGGEDAPNHILIEGDNLEALTALTYTHEGRVDVIYIDPPYNTGNKDFVYNDSFVDSEDGYRHSKWLSFMEKRLKIAKKLLSDKGVIFISIDDNEQANLKLLCDEVFDSSNFVGSLPRITKASGKTTGKIANNHDYILIYCKSISDAIIEGLPHDDDGFKYSDEYKGSRGLYKLNQTLDYDSLSYSEGLDYPIEIDGETLYPGGSYQQYLKRKAGGHKRADWAWRWSKELYQFGLDNGFIVLKRGKTGARIYTKTYQFATIEKDGEYYKIALKDRKKPIQSIEFVNNLYSNDNAKKELGRIFENIPFDYPKPTSIMIQFLRAIPNANYVLDFFAGSGTTLHATMQLNAEDGGHRQCILVTNNENNICRDVTYERNKRVIQGYTTPKGVAVEGLKQNNLRYYKVDFVPRDNSLTGKRKLMEASTELICIKHDIYNEVFTFGSLKLRPHISRYFEDKGQKVLIIYKEEAIEYFVKEIARMPEGMRIMVYVFSTNNYALDADFEEVADKVTLCALPAAIYNAYLKVLPKKKVAVEAANEKEEELSLFDGEEDMQ